MRPNSLTIGTSLTALPILGGAGQSLDAQITNEIRAHIDHSFIIGGKTLAPGEYTFRIADDSDLTEMTARSEDSKSVVSFIVRESRDEQRPNHSELLFRKYGDSEFLSKIYQSGSRIGVALTETSKQEEELAKQSQATEHREEQK